MKINFRKIASVLTSTVMLTSTVGFAAAANYPAPFVKSGNADVAVVWGSSAQASDLVAVTDITADLQAELASQTATSGGSSSSTSVSGGDFVKLERNQNKFNLGEDTNDFYSTLSDEELSMVLADGVYWNDANEDFDYEQEILMGDLDLEHFTDSSFNDDKPVLGFNLDSGDHVMNYTLDFTPEAAEGGSSFANLENTELEMLGRSFFVSEVETTSNGVKISLLDAANTATLKETESTTVTVGEETYEVSVQTITDDNPDEVRLVINGEVTNSLSEGDTAKLKDGSYVGIKDVSYSEKKDSVVEFSIGTGQIVLENGQEVQVNDDDISELEDENGYSSEIKAFVTNSSTNIEAITLVWNLDDDAWVTEGTDLVMPGFNTIKLSMGDFFTAKQETTSISDSADSVVVSTYNTDGALDLPILYANSGVTAFEGLGKKASERLVTNTTVSSQVVVRLNESEKSYFVATWIDGDDAESYAFQIGGISSADGKNQTDLNNLADGGSDVSFSEVGKDKTVGQVKLTLLAANDDQKVARVMIERSGSSGSVYADRLVTKEGLQFRLPVLATTNDSIGVGFVNLTGSLNPATTTSFVMVFTEENDNDNIASGSNFNITLGIDSGDGTEPTATTVTTYEIEDDSDIKEGYVVSALATKVTFNNPSDGLADMDVVYHGSEAYADVFVSETGAVITSDGETVVSSGTVKRLGSVAVSDAEVASVSSKNLIVVGGSAVNSVAAELLGGAFSGAAFEQATGAGAGQFVIETFSRAGGKVATLVAGYNAADTSNAARYLTTSTVDTTVGKKYLGTSATSAELVTEAA